LRSNHEKKLHSAGLSQISGLPSLGGLARTFGTMASFLAALLLIPGLYLIEDALAHPLEAQGAGLIAGAFIIALASLMLFFVFKPRKRSARRKFKRHTHRASRSNTPTLEKADESIASENVQEEVPFQMAGGTSAAGEGSS
jgi:Na+/melibiose symporter-like transporter